jgi:hypothetical protein
LGEIPNPKIPNPKKISNDEIPNSKKRQMTKSQISTRTVSRQCRRLDVPRRRLAGLRRLPRRRLAAATVPSAPLSPLPPAAPASRATTRRAGPVRLWNFAIRDLEFFWDLGF